MSTLNPVSLAVEEQKVRINATWNIDVPQQHIENSHRAQDLTQVCAYFSWFLSYSVKYRLCFSQQGVGLILLFYFAIAIMSFSNNSNQSCRSQTFHYTLERCFSCSLRRSRRTKCYESFSRRLDWFLYSLNSPGSRAVWGAQARGGEGEQHGAGPGYPQGA